VYVYRCRCEDPGRSAHVVFFLSWASREVASEELEVQAALKERLSRDHVQLRELWGNYLFHLDDLPFDVGRDCPSVFTHFRKAVEKRCPVRDVLPIPDPLRPPPALVDSGSRAPTLDAPVPGMADLGLPEAWEAHPLEHEEAQAVLAYRGGEAAALARVQSYFWELDCLKDYKNTRNELLGPNYSSKLAPWLAQGSVSPRFVYSEIQRYEAERVANESTYWLFFELLWRDFFRLSAMFFGNDIFKLGGPQRQPRKYPWVRNTELFEAWRQGKTGYPFIDANMRELAATGFMSNRGRQVVASFLTKDLLIDWRLGAHYFEEMLLDYDVASNYGNWTYVAGVGSDPREDRYFNGESTGRHEVLDSS
jgi:deoxyribodipyrimidine photo-lyase